MIDYIKANANVIKNIICFILVFIFVSFSNFFDWDYFLTTFEIDLRSWFIDYTPPLWSYQFCSGVTRIGDPQSFGLSPLFLPIFFLGSFWGTKVIVILLCIVGFYYSKKLIELLTPYQSSDAINNFFTLSFIFSNYFLWHMHHGHVTFFVMMLGLGVIYYSLISLWKNLTLKENVFFILCLWGHFSGGFYHSFIFLMVPFYLALSIYLVLNLSVSFENYPRKIWLKKISNLAMIHLFGLGLCYYKLIGVLNYQLQHPRIVENTNESLNLIDLFTFHFIPSFDYLFLNLNVKNQVWGIWEYSSFSASALLLLILIPLFFKRNFKIKLSVFKWFKTKENLFFALYALAVISLCLGSFSSLSPFALLNKVLNNSVRVVGRFGVGLSFVLTIVAAKLLHLLPKLEVMIKKHGLSFFVVFLLFNFFTFRRSLDYGQLKRNNGLETKVLNEMQFLQFAKKRDMSLSYMYPVVKEGFAVTNCYQPLARETYLSDEFNHNYQGGNYTSFLDVTDQLERNCLDKSYFNQNEIYVDPTCPKVTCLNINGKNPHLDQPQIRFNPFRKKYCWYQNK